MAVSILLGLTLLLATATANPQSFSGPSGATCPDSCPDTFRPVCGTDNKVYGNECKLFQAVCRTSGLAKSNDGPCVERNSCQRQCPTSYQPVCATSGQTFDNKCLLAVGTCENSNVQLRYEGVCAVPANGAPTTASRPSSGGALQPAARPSTGSGPAVGQSVLSLVTGGNRPQASAPAPAPLPAPSVVQVQPSAVGTSTNRCPDNCQEGFRPVCSNEGKVYANDCKLRVAACQDPRIQKRNDGVCAKDCSIACSDEVDPVCGSDGVTYKNVCFFTVANCRDPAVKRVSNGACEVVRNDRCDFACDRTINPVCGSDGRTYGNPCKLQAAACYTSSLIKLYDGQCVEQLGSRCDTQCPTELIYVCGDDGLTYRNHCELIMSACRANKRVNKAYDGRCRA